MTRAQEKLIESRMFILLICFTYHFDSQTVSNKFKDLLFITEPVDGAVLHEAEVVLGEGGDEDDGAHVLEAVDPLLSL